MPPTKSVWMSDEDALLWDSLPKGQRSEIFKIAFRNWKSESMPSEKMELLQKLEYLKKRAKELDEIYGQAEGAFFQAQEEVEMVQTQLRKFHPSNIVTEEGEISPDPIQFYNTFLEHAQKYLEEGKIFHSPSGQNRYRVHSIENQKVFIERIDSKSPKPSSFTYETVRKAVRRLSDGKFLKPGQFMPVLAQECAVVEIHPDMRKFGWKNEFGESFLHSAESEFYWKSKEVVE